VDDSKTLQYNTMTKILNFELIRYNRTQSEMYLDDANQRNAELFMAISVSVDTKTLQLHFNNAGGIQRVIDTMEEMLRALKESEARKKN
jgi:hypothetical protein